ncbi:AAA family ATPase [Actinoplanes bogorensis]|uniref:AAA family ATPase n=1 Tax=Paractinoplanes bogorensis TaxID=1610840 RepID=A0ABS5YPA8_9ACTN|nr:AAA family ATPase [Actinoplanes bogorensis]MBU2665213.1 AAA family ATPase [Actinoplanes bogorensis]
MARHILTGTPGSGKTAILRRLELFGHAVVEEAATDVIALSQATGTEEPWRDASFLDRIVSLQRRRSSATGPGLTFFDRSPVCTLALCRHLGLSAPATLVAEVDRARDFYSPAVFFVRNLGFVRPTAARRINFEESLAFERIHEEVYREAGFTLIEVPAGPLETRAALIREAAAC